MAFSFDLTAMLTNLDRSIPEFMRLVAGAAYVMGVTFTASALYHLKIYGELRTMMSSQTGLKQPISYIIVAGMCFYLPTAIRTVLVTTFGYDNPLSYSEMGGGTMAIRVMLQFIRLIGFIAFIRGWVMIARASQQSAQPGMFGKALIYILGGIFAINIVGTARVVGNTLGITF